MSYCIEYNPEKNRKYPTSNKRKPWWLLAVIAAMIVLFAVQNLDSNHKVLSWILPGNPSVTADAFSSMTEQIKEGQPVTDAITAFCVEIIQNG